MYGYVKALHLIGVVSWFAGLLYVVRLYVYHAEAFARPEPERSTLARQFGVMERRLWYGITVPAMIVTVGFGLWLMILIRGWELPWFQLKLALVVALLAYHAYCGGLRKRLERAEGLSAPRPRGPHEGGTLFLVAIVCVAATKSPWAALWGSLGFLAHVGLVMLLIRAIRRRSPA